LGVALKRLIVERLVRKTMTFVHKQKYFSVTHQHQLKDFERIKCLIIDRQIVDGVCFGSRRHVIPTQGLTLP
jgi:hypothetical protein